MDDVARDFLKAWDILNISHDDFIRTTEERHHRGVQEIIRRIEATAIGPHDGQDDVEWSAARRS